MARPLRGPTPATVWCALTALWAAIWPVAWISRAGVGVKLGMLLAASFGIYRLIHPTVARWLREPDEAGGE